MMILQLQHILRLIVIIINPITLILLIHLFNSLIMSITPCPIRRLRRNKLIHKLRLTSCLLP